MARKNYANHSLEKVLKALSDIGGMRLWIIAGLTMGCAAWLFRQKDASPAEILSALTIYAIAGLVAALFVAMAIAGVRTLATVIQTVLGFFRPLATATNGNINGPDYDPGGAGVTAPLKPSPPAFTERAAKPIPTDEDGGEPIRLIITGRVI